jgi:hypothetical protein
VRVIHKFFSGAALALAASCSGALIGAPAAADFSAEYVFGDSLGNCAG